MPASNHSLCRNEPSPFAFVVDDDLVICRVITLLLAKLGVDALSFHSAQSALAALDAQPPHIVFLDVALAQSDAVDMIKGLSAAKYDGIVQVVSGASPVLLETVVRIGVREGLRLQPTLQKPFKARTIRRAVAPLLANSPVAA